ncbi:MAG: aldehyde dehydrogenase family protein [Pseudooceanicola sp.]
MNLGQHYINGEWVTPLGTERFPVMNPATNEQIDTVVLGNKADVDRAVAAARAAFETFSMTSKEERVALLKRLLAQTNARIDDLAAAITAEIGAPVSIAKDEHAATGVLHLEAFIRILEEQAERETLENGDVLLREPVGVCGLITPWNWPINQVAAKVIPALAAGCTIVLKPSEHTPMAAAIYAEIVHDAGYPAGVFNLVQGDGPTVGAAISSHPDVDMVSFTGSTRAGKIISKNAADTIKRVALELGGKSPNIVFADSDLERQITDSIVLCMFNTGQCCDAPTRMLVERSVYEEALKIAKAAGESVEVGDPKEEGDHIGPQFDKIQYDRVQELIQKGIDEGATLLVGGLGKPEGFEKGWYTKPTIFADVSNDMTIAQEEIFGPVLSIIPFEDEEDAIRIANDTPYGLHAYIQSGDLERAERVARRIRAGGVQINGGPFKFGSPFGGYKQSGNGREGGEQGLEEYQEVKILHVPV